MYLKVLIVNEVRYTLRGKYQLDCKEYLAAQKWETGYTCVKCHNKTYQVRKDHSRTCNKCSHTESSGANTIFHKLKFGLRKAFHICFEMSTSTKSLSARYVAVRYDITERTARLWMHKVRAAMKSSESYPLVDDVEVDEFVVGGHESGKVGRSYHTKKKKAVCAVEFSQTGKVKRMYIRKIDSYGAKDLREIFEKHISTSANVKTDKWRGYGPLMKDYNITQELSTGGLAFKKLHTMIHQVKSWIRTTYSWVSTRHIQRYFDEFCYRINRSQSRETIFHNLIQRMVRAKKLYHAEIVCG